jgi:DUF4097 and DUF4098 domain-containing protein YvlB
MSRFFSVSVLLLSLSACGGPVVAVESLDHSFTTTATPHVVVTSFDGRVDVIVGSSSAVMATVKKTAHGWSEEDARRHLDNVAVTFTQDGDTVTLSARRTNAAVDFASGADFTISVPAGATLDLSSSDGDLSVSGTTGAIAADTSNGDVTLRAGSGTIRASTSNGRIRVTPIEAAVVTASSSNGSLEFRGPLLAGVSTFETSNGDVDLFVPAGGAFHLDAETSDGEVSCELPMVVTRSSPTRLIADVGTSPNVQVRATTSNGSVRISQQ